MNMPSPIPWTEYLQAALDPIGPRHLGLVTQIVGLLVEGRGPLVSIGEVCEILPSVGPPIPAEVVGFRENVTLLMPLGKLEGIRPGSIIRSKGTMEWLKVGDNLLGRILDPMGQPLDGGPAPHVLDRIPLHGDPINPLVRRRIDAPLDVGVRTINGLLTLGRGQRIGIFAGSGVGKSTLLGMMARYTDADVNVLALVGERGREVVEFLQRDLGPEGLARSVVVVATSEQSPLLRLRAAWTATAIAEYFRSRNRNVLLLMDSLTRFAMAQREVGLTAGEPPTSKGYPPSAFLLLPKLLERAGRDQGEGSVTGVYTVLMEGDDLQDPIVDAARGILDGHIVLSRDIADSGQYPAIDVLGSLSRLMPEVVDARHKEGAAKVRRMLATYNRAEDMINIGAYAAGSNPDIDAAIRLMPNIRAFLAQAVEEPVTLADSARQLQKLVA